MNKGQLVFGILCIAISIYMTYFDYSISVGPYRYVWLQFVFWPIGFIGFILILLNLTIKSGVSFSYRHPSPSSIQVQVKRDSTQISRVIINTITGEECIINGKPEWSYRMSLLADWPFKDIPKSGDWIVKDERGNDITNTPLIQYNSIASIEYVIRDVVESGDSRVKEDEQRDDYTSIDQGVTYYD
ncbi:MAG: hypothetical protein ACFFF4_02010 [Candidatus Thorarchaeota archaeon]